MVQIERLWWRGIRREDYLEMKAPSAEYDPDRPYISPEIADRYMKKLGELLANSKRRHYLEENRIPYCKICLDVLKRS